MGLKSKLSLADLQLIETLVEKKVDRLVDEKISAMRAQGLTLRPRRTSRWPAGFNGEPPPLDGEAYCRNSAELARTLGLPRDDIRVMRTYARNDPTTSPFLGWGAYPSKVRQWLQERSTVPALSRMLRRLRPVNRTAPGPASTA